MSAATVGAELAEHHRKNIDSTMEILKRELAAIEAFQDKCKTGAGCTPHLIAEYAAQIADSVLSREHELEDMYAVLGEKCSKLQV